MKVNNTRPVSHLLIKILISFWPLSSIHLFQSNQRFQAIEFVDRHVSENLIFPKLSSQNMRGFDHATILSPIFHGLRKERLAQWLPFCAINTKENGLRIMSFAAYASETN